MPTLLDVANEIPNCDHDVHANMMYKKLMKCDEWTHYSSGDNGQEVFVCLIGKVQAKYLLGNTVTLINTETGEDAAFSVTGRLAHSLREKIEKKFRKKISQMEKFANAMCGR
jgi:hypothetical protein